MGRVSELPVIARKLEGKVAVITGGASGIGECIARLFYKPGANVIIADVQDELENAVCSTDLGSADCNVTHEDDIASVGGGICIFIRLQLGIALGLLPPLTPGLLIM